MTTSAPWTTWKATARSRRSWSVERGTRTSAPSSRKRVVVGRPRKPAPPVTTTSLPDQKLGSGAPVVILGRLAAASYTRPARGAEALGHHTVLQPGALHRAHH